MPHNNTWQREDMPFSKGKYYVSTSISGVHLHTKSGIQWKHYKTPKVARKCDSIEK